MKAPKGAFFYSFYKAMKTHYSLLLSCRALQGYDVCGEFPLGSYKVFANQLFENLHGDESSADALALHLDLFEAGDGLQEKIETKCCTLEQWCHNSKQIIEEIFSFKNLETILDHCF
jgi:hypothetical protein